MANLKFTLKGNNETPARFAGETRNFKLVVDEPEALGGTDQAPNPVEYILAGYAGCLNVVGHLVAKELDINLKSLDIELGGEINPAKLFGQDTRERAGYQSINVTLSPETDASDELLLQWLQEVERRCPVNDNLANPTPINVEIARKQEELLQQEVAA